ncbi:MAG: hypothetical protein ACD_22C00100G0028 [uncultured bacterium]|nr:MAG: hypothetical protein ACD_22C00100G0028 [uncultured bacterium]
MKELFESQQFKNICNDHNISYLGLFGSYARGDNRRDSDVDLLVQFNKPIGYFGLVRAQRSLGKYLGKEVDLVTKGSLSDRIFPYVKKDLKTIYAS